MRSVARTWRELWTHRALVGTLVQRQVAARYRGSALGFLWTLLNPILLMLVYTLVFSIYLRFDMKGYPVFLFSGLLPWIWFSSSAIEGMHSITGGAGLVTRVLFPPQILPAVTVLSNMANMLLGLPVLFLFMIFLHVSFHPTLVLLPLLILIEALFTLGVTFALAALNVHYRDIQHLVANGITLWFFLTPVLYPVDKVPERYRLLVWANPMAPVVAGFQDAVVHGRFPAAGPLLWAAVAGCLTAVAGAAILAALRDSFAEDL